MADDVVLAPPGVQAPAKKKSLWKSILLVLLGLIALLLIVVALQPDDFRYSRSTVIAAKPEVVFPHVNDLKQWDDWSPWAKLDPNMKEEYSDPTSGKEAWHSWNGNAEVGEGKMTIVESRPSELIRIRLEFLKPMQAVNDTEFTFKPEGEGTRVTWTMAGKNGFVGKLFCLLMNMEKMLGDQFAQGLAKMKEVVESKPVK